MFFFLASASVEVMPPRGHAKKHPFGGPTGQGPVGDEGLSNVAFWRSYCWWKNPANELILYGKSHIIDIMYGFLYIPGGAGFLPSTVRPSNCFEISWNQLFRKTTLFKDARCSHFEFIILPPCLPTANFLSKTQVLDSFATKKRTLVTVVPPVTMLGSIVLKKIVLAKVRMFQVSRSIFVMQIQRWQLAVSI